MEDRLPAGVQAHAQTDCISKRPRTRPDAMQEIALVSQARRELLLRVHRHRLRKEDLEDCYSQATLELLAKARPGEGRTGYVSRVHMANVLEQRFLARIYDRRRALGGRSPAQAALDRALPLGSEQEGGVDVADVRAELERIVTVRGDLRRLSQVIRELTPDQRLVLLNLADSGLGCAGFCERFGWTKEKYRKVSQRARARLRELMSSSEEGFTSHVSRTGTAVGERGRDPL